MKKIRLEQWIKDQQNKLRGFELYWKSQFYSDPENFPMEIPKGDWEEQFDFYCEELGGKRDE